MPMLKRKISKAARGKKTSTHRGTKYTSHVLSSMDGAFFAAPGLTLSITQSVLTATAFHT